MNKLNERLTLIANISVVFGILFLAVELQKNTQAIQAQTRDSITEKQMTYLGWVATSSELAAVAEAIEESGDPSIDGAAGRQWRSYAAGQMREFENSFYQYERGLFTEAELESRRSRWRGVMTLDAYQAWWMRLRVNFAPSFRAEIDRIVAEVGG